MTMKRYTDDDEVSIPMIKKSTDDYDEEEVKETGN